MGCGFCGRLKERIEHNVGDCHEGSYVHVLGVTFYVSLVASRLCLLSMSIAHKARICIVHGRATSSLDEMMHVANGHCTLISRWTKLVPPPAVLVSSSEKKKEGSYVHNKFSQILMTDRAVDSPHGVRQLWISQNHLVPRLEGWRFIALCQEWRGCRTRALYRHQDHICHRGIMLPPDHRMDSQLE